MFEEPELVWDEEKEIKALEEHCAKDPKLKIMVEKGWLRPEHELSER